MLVHCRRLNCRISEVEESPDAIWPRPLADRQEAQKGAECAEATQCIMAELGADPASETRPRFIPLPLC